MLNIVSFTFNPFQENTYVIFNEKKQCWIVDPGMYGPAETGEMTDYIAQNGWAPQAIINTHTHIDHVLGVKALVGRYSIPFGIHELELPLLQFAPASAQMFGISFTDVLQPSFFIKEGALLMLGADALDVLLTPGHSPGSVSFFYPAGNWVVSGDVLFAGSIGRTDLPGGSYETLLHSIRTQLFRLPDATIVYSGHGPETSIGEERAYNPFLAG